MLDNAGSWGTVNGGWIAAAWMTRDWASLAWFRRRVSEWRRVSLEVSVVRSSSLPFFLPIYVLALKTQRNGAPQRSGNVNGRQELKRWMGIHCDGNGIGIQT